MNLKEKIREIPDYPQKGISFKDITTILQDAAAFRYSIDRLARFAEEHRADLIVGPEARGFTIAAPIAYALGKGFVPVRKPGKLPAETVAMDYELEYGVDTLEIHKDAIRPGQRVVIADDLLATGGTTQTAARLVEKLGGQVVGAAFLIELTYLHGREKLKDYDVLSLVQY